MNFPAYTWSIVLASLCSASALAQTPVPTQLQGLPTLPPFPYSDTTGALGPFFDVVDPLGDLDLFAYADAYWTDIDQNGTTTLSARGWTWTAPSLVEAETAGLVPGTAAMVDPWDGALELFQFLYAHRIGDGGAESFYDLCLEDIVVASAFKHYTRTHQLATSTAWDATAHGIHIDLLTDAFTGASYASSRGIPYLDGATIVSDRTRISKWQNVPSIQTTVVVGGPFDSGGTIGGTTLDEVQDCIEMHKGDLVGHNADTTGDGKADCTLYKPDVSGGWFGNGAKPGFDCDDFSDAIGARLTKDKPGASYSNVYCSWELPGSGKRVAHLVTRVDVGGSYFLVDAQTGSSSGPHDAGTPMDAGEVVKPSGYNIDPGTMQTGGTSAPNDRSDWQGWTGSGEPEAWNTDDDARQHFEDKTGLSADDYTQ